MDFHFLKQSDDTFPLLKPRSLQPFIMTSRNQPMLAGQFSVPNFGPLTRGFMGEPAHGMQELAACTAGDDTSCGLASESKCITV